MVTAMMILGETTTMRCHRTKMGKKLGAHWIDEEGQGFTKVQKERREVKSEKCRDSWPPVLLRCCKSPNKMEAVAAAPEAGIFSRAIIIFPSCDYFPPLALSSALGPQTHSTASLTSQKPSPQWKLLSEQNPPKSYTTFTDVGSGKPLGWKLVRKRPLGS